jgi:hypothetical protein
VGRRVFFRLHFVQHDAYAAAGGLPGRLATGEPAADDCYRFGQMLLQWSVQKKKPCKSGLQGFDVLNA